MHSTVIADAEAKFADVRSLIRWSQPNIKHECVENFEACDSFEKGIHTILEGGYPIDILIDIIPGAPLVIFFNAAQDRSEELKLPVFVGLGIVPRSDVSRICINDPGMYLSPDIKIAWYAGMEGVDLQAILPRVLDTLIKAADTQKVIFIGGSGGGFASLYYSRLIPGSLAVIWNPQTDILKFKPQHVAKYAYEGFGLSDIDVAKESLGEYVDVDLCSLYKEDRRNHVLYFQNASDWHTKIHCMPFLEGLGHEVGSEKTSSLLDQRTFLHVGNWGDGHIEVPRSLLKEVLERILESEGPLADLFVGDSLGLIIAESAINVPEEISE